MKSKTYGWALGLVLISVPAFAGDFGFPTLNTVGRYWGVGWSHHTYHSQVDGRFDAISNRHPSCAYPSSSLSQFYSPDYTNFPPRPAANNGGNGFWRAPTVVPSTSAETSPSDSILNKGNKAEKGESTKPKLAPSTPLAEELSPPQPIKPKPQDPPKPKEPPPSWLKPYLDNEKNKPDSELIELEPSPNDGNHSAQMPVNRYRL